MTLVLSTATPLYVLQVSDRLVSRVPSMRAYDSSSNKSIVLRARDAVATVAYSGVAFIGAHPTDHWLAECIVGQPLQGQGFSGGPALPDLGRIIFRIGDGYSALPEATRREGLEIAICGLQFLGRRQMRQVVWTLRPTPDCSGILANQMVPRHLPDRNGRATTAVPLGRIVGPELSALTASLMATGIDGFDEAQTVLLDAVREEAGRPSSGVGAHCMTVVIAPMAFEHVRVRYVPAPEAVSAADDIKVYAPWILARGLVAAPAEIVGRGVWEADGLKVVIEAPPVPAGTTPFASMKSQRRPKRPRGLPR